MFPPADRSTRNRPCNVRRFTLENGISPWAAALAVPVAVMWQPALAQIIYSPTPVTAIPTMGAYALILLSVLLAVTAFFKGGLRRQGINGVVALCLCGAAVSGLSGLELVTRAHADGNGGASAVLGFIDSPTGGSVPITGGALNIFENTSGVRQRLDDVIVPPGCANTDSGPIDGAPQCRVGSTIATGTSGMCYADCRDTD